MAAMPKKKIGQIALLMAGIVAVSAVITAFTGKKAAPKEGVRVVASFYPVYIAALNVVGDIEGVDVVSLTQPQMGCLHDYQLSPDNLLTLEAADVLVLNGAGAESFLESVLNQQPQLPVIDTSAGVELLETDGHAHSEGDGHDHGDEMHNEHIWTSPSAYRRQVENLRDGLCAVDPDHAEAYRANAQAYTAAIEQAYSRLKQAVSALPYTNSIIFHNSLAYFARDLGLPVAASLFIGEEAGVSAADLLRAQKAAETAENVLLLYDSQYPVEYTYVADKAAAHAVLTMNMAVTGAKDKNAWLSAMAANAEALEALAVQE